MTTTTTTATKVSLVKMAKEQIKQATPKLNELDVNLINGDKVTATYQHITTLNQEIKTLQDEKKQSLRDLLSQVLELTKEAKQCPHLVQLDNKKLIKFISTKYQFKGVMLSVCNYIESGLTLKLSEITPSQLVVILKAYSLNVVTKNEVKKLETTDLLLKCRKGLMELKAQSK